MREFNDVVTASGMFAEFDQKHIICFGTLQDMGVLDKHYECTGDPDAATIVWTVKEACIINGVVYNTLDEIRWEK